jgi:hypothetical protein
MAYLPKSKYNKKYTNGGEFREVSSGKIYVGPYLELANGQFFIGDSLTTIGGELIIFKKSNFKIDSNPATRVYRRINSTYTEKEEKYEIPTATKSRPSQNDYLVGSYVRYFLYKKPTKTYIEVDFKTYKAAFKGQTIDSSIYKPGKITWALKGDTEMINAASILKIQNIFPNLKNLFNNLTEYTIKSETENLTAKVNELVYLDGSPFPEGGKYHIHPEKGPMEGAFHRKVFHETLRFVEEENNQPQTDSPEVETPTPTTTPPPPVITSSPISYGGGGGGGY